MRARLLPEADAEIREAAQWYEDRRSGMADQFLDAVLDALSDIEAHPLRYTSPPGLKGDRTVRRRLLAGFPYAVIYEVRAKELLVLAVAHARRKPGYWKERNR